MLWIRKFDSLWYITNITDNWLCCFISVSFVFYLITFGLLLIKIFLTMKIQNADTHSPSTHLLLFNIPLTPRYVYLSGNKMYTRLSTQKVVTSGVPFWMQTALNASVKYNSAVNLGRSMSWIFFNLSLTTSGSCKRSHAVVANRHGNRKINWVVKNHSGRFWWWWWFFDTIANVWSVLQDDPIVGSGRGALFTISLTESSTKLRADTSDTTVAGNWHCNE